MTELTVPGWVAALPVETLIMAVPTSLIAASGTWRMVTAPAALVVGEAARWSIPFGGVAMSNLALGQVDGPWLSVASAAGSLGIIAVVGVGAVVVERLCAREWMRVWKPALVLGVVSVAVLAVPDTAVSATIDAAVVQAGGELGTNVSTPQRSARLRHLQTTADWSGSADLMVWSESSTSSDGPLEASARLAELEVLAAERDLVLVANFYERTADESPPRFRNVTVAVGPSLGLTDRYDKAHLVPFGEYVPLRGLVEPFADLSLIAREAIAGVGPGVVRTPLGDIAVATSYEIYFPGLVRDGVRAGGSIVANPHAGFLVPVLGSALSVAGKRPAPGGRDRQMGPAGLDHGIQRDRDARRHRHSAQRARRTGGAGGSGRAAFGHDASRRAGNVAACNRRRGGVVVALSPLWRQLALVGHFSRVSPVRQVRDSA